VTSNKVVSGVYLFYVFKMDFFVNCFVVKEIPKSAKLIK